MTRLMTITAALGLLLGAGHAQADKTAKHAPKPIATFRSANDQVVGFVNAIRHPEFKGSVYAVFSGSRNGTNKFQGIVTQGHSGEMLTPDAWDRLNTKGEYTATGELSFRNQQVFGGSTPSAITGQLRAGKVYLVEADKTTKALKGEAPTPALAAARMLLPGAMGQGESVVKTEVH